MRAGLVSGRRRIGLVALALLAAGPARAEFISAPDVVVYCDDTLAAAARAVGRAWRDRTGVPVRVLAAPGPQLLALIAHGTRNDLLFTQSNWMDQAAARRLADPATRRGDWQDRMVLAGAPPPALPGLPGLPDQAGIAALLRGRPLGVIDPVTQGGPDGPALVARLGWTVPLAGEISGPGVAFLVRSGEAGLGLMQRSAALARPALPVAATVPAALAPPPRYAIAMSHNALSRNAAALLDFFAGAEATSVLRDAGLDAA